MSQFVPKIVPQTGGGLRALGERIGRLAEKIDPRSQEFRQAVQPILDRLDKINEQERLAGLDRNGNRLPPPKYRPKAGSTKTPKGRREPKFANADAYGNLPPKAYLSLTGPRLAPQNRKSRIISNYRVSLEFRRNEWRVRAGWLDILDRNGKPFLQYHINGSGKLPKCDIGAISKRALREISQMALQTIRDGIQ